MQDKFQTVEEFLENPDGTTPPEETATPPKETVTPPEETATPPEETPTPPEETETPPKKPKGKSGGDIAALRKAKDAAEKERSKIANAMEKFTEGEYKFSLKDFRTEEGKVDYDALITAMNEADVAKRAETRGLTPEMQAEIERYEQEKIQIQRDRMRIDMERKINSFQAEMGMTSEEVNLFISEAAKLGINPLSVAALDKTSKGTAALRYLHTAINHDKILKEAVDKAVAEERAKWEVDTVAKRNQPKGNPANPNTNKTDPKDPTGIALDDFLKSLG